MTSAYKSVVAMLLSIALCLALLPEELHARDVREIRAPLPPVLPWSGASEALIAAPDDPWITPAERDGFERTPGYVETRQWLERLTKKSPLLNLHGFGRSAEGRELYYIRATPRRKRNRGAERPVVLIQAGIHSHEIDGKDGGLMLLRDIGLRTKSSLVDVVDLVFVPIYNVDGHERASSFNGAHLRGPENRGTRTTAQRINLNLDYAKADAPETRAMLRLIQKLEPVLYIDVHVSDGFDHGYDVTYTYAAWGRYMHSEAISAWLNGPFETTVNAFLRQQGHHPHFYPSAFDDRDLTRGLRVSAEAPRWSTGYGDHIRMPTVLVEMHHLKPYRQRVLGAYSMMEGALRAATEHLRELEAAITTDRALRPDNLVVRWGRSTEPMEEIAFRGVAQERYESPVSGAEEVRYLGRTEPLKLSVIGQYPLAEVALPVAWWIPPAETAVIERLEIHGIQFERSDSATELELEMVRMRDVQLSRVYDVRVQMTGTAVRQYETVRMPAGAVRVRFDQPKGLLAAALLEPEAEDSLFSWGFFPSMARQSGSMERFIAAPLASAMLEADPALRNEFDKKLKDDPEFAGDAQARLRWFQERSGYADATVGLYPIGREMPPGESQAAGR